MLKFEKIYKVLYLLLMSFNNIIIENICNSAYKGFWVPLDAQKGLKMQVLLKLILTGFNICHSIFTHSFSLTSLNKNILLIYRTRLSITPFCSLDFHVSFNSKDS